MSAQAIDGRLDSLATSAAQPRTSTGLWRSGPGFWLLVAITLAAVGFVFHDGIVELLRIWDAADEYNHGYLIPFISLFLLWRVRADLARIEFAGSWVGVAVCVLSLVVLAIGELAALYALVQYALVGFLAGMLLTIVGFRGMRYAWPAAVFLCFMVPLPVFIYQKLSGVLQIISSELGVMVIRWFGISVYLEGNVIDLGSYQLQVVEACNGLRYLFPLMSFGFLCAYLFTAPFWQRALLFLSTIPITVLMNSFRIGVIGVLVEHKGIGQAEGFLHDFEGWVIFMACVALLMVEMWLLTQLTRRGTALAEVFGFDSGDPMPDGARATRRLRVVMLAPLLLLVPMALALSAVDERVEDAPERADFTSFPLNVAGWSGRPDRLSGNVRDALRLSDYALVNYKDGAGNHVNFYSAWYDTQRKGQSVHSPASCIPGGGWKISSIETVDTGVQIFGKPLPVNRAIISRGEQRQLVYYWFQQRGRLITNEYVYKAMLVYDSMVINRSDGALVRLVTPLRPTEDPAQGDARLTEFLEHVRQPLEATVPA